MRVIPLVAVILATIIGFGLWTEKSIAKTAAEIDQTLGEIEKAVMSSNWDSANQKLKLVQNQWEKIKKSWSIIVDHKEIDNIDTGMKRLEKYIEARGKALALGEISSLRLYVTHIPGKESLNWDALL